MDLYDLDMQLDGYDDEQRIIICWYGSSYLPNKVKMQYVQIPNI